HTLAFRPSGFGVGLGATVRVVLPRAAHLAGQTGAKLTRTLRWQVASGSTLRLQQLLAQLGYLPVTWRPTLAAPRGTLRAQLDAAVSPPAGRVSWRYPKTPPELRALWQPGHPNQIARGAVMMVAGTRGLAADAPAGPDDGLGLL